MYFRNNSPRTTCLYSAASMLLRNLSAAFQSLSSKPRFAPFELGCRSGGVLPDKVSLSVIGEYGNSVFIGINLLPLFLIGSRKRRVLMVRSTMLTRGFVVLDLMLRSLLVASPLTSILVCRYSTCSLGVLNHVLRHCT